MDFWLVCIYTDQCVYAYNLSYSRKNDMDKESFGYTNWLVYILSKNTDLP